MKAVERYRAELDAISAPATLKETLYAIPAQYPIAQDAPAMSDTQNTRYATNAPDMPAAQNAPNTSGTADAKPKKAIRFTLPPSWKKYALTAAACFVLGVLANDATYDTQDFTRSIADNAMSGEIYTSSTTSSVTYDAGASAASVSLDGASADANSVSAITLDDTDTDSDSTSSRKIIYSTYLTLESMAYDETLTALTTAMNATGGYLEYSEAYTESNDERAGYFVYRIPATAYNSFLSSIGEAGSVTYLSESANDVTSSYLDLEARITTLTQQRDRLWELQAAAQTLTELLEIESTLTDVLYQIESYQSQLNYLAEQVDYATVSVQLNEVLTFTTVEPTAWETIRDTFISSTTNFAATISSVLLFFISIWVWIALALIGVFVYYRVKKKRNAS